MRGPRETKSPRSMSQSNMFDEGRTYTWTARKDRASYEKWLALDRLSDFFAVCYLSAKRHDLLFRASERPVLSGALR